MQGLFPCPIVYQESESTVMSLDQSLDGFHFKMFIQKSLIAVGPSLVGSCKENRPREQDFYVISRKVGPDKILPQKNPPVQPRCRPQINSIA